LLYSLSTLVLSTLSVQAVAETDPNPAISMRRCVTLLFLGSDGTAGGILLEGKIMFSTRAVDSPVLILASSSHFL
jgi:hypothetical protein